MPSDLLVPVALPDIDAGQVGYNERPQFLVRRQLEEWNKYFSKHTKKYKMKRLLNFASQ